MFFILLIVFIELIILLTNFTHGTFLMGWDNVMPEFNLWVNFKRSLFGVWANFRGLGFTNGMSEISNLTHTIYVSFLSLFLGKSDIRYFSIIILHLAGGIGFYLLTKKLISNSKASLIGALFYMFNIGVIQMFYAPLEAFAFHFASLPIGALLITNSLNKTSKKNLLFLFLGGLFFSPQAFVPTVFIVFLLLLASLLLINFLKEKNFKKILIVALIFLASNAYWLLPYLYSGPKEAPIIQNTRINQFASPEVYYRNQNYGDIKSVLAFRGFMLDTIEYNPVTKKDYSFMQVWEDQHSQPYYQLAFLMLALVSGLGVYYCFYKKKTELYPYAITLIIPFIFLANKTFPFEQLNTILRNTFPLFGEIFRFPFTKFIIIFTFSFSIFLAFGVDILINKIKRWKIYIFYLLLSLIFILSFPVFTGNFFSPNLKLKLPTYYIQMFDFLNSQDENKRIALLPLDTFWNWRYSDWGDFGSGFVWYGIKQPVLSRAFDPWSNYNEQFYNELAYAINTSNPNLFNSVVNKYDIGYLLLDESFINAITRKPVDYNSLESFLKTNKLIKEEKRLGKLVLYRVNSQNSSWIYQLQSNQTLKAFPSFKNENEDTIQQITKTNNYIVSPNNPDVIPLFPSLYTGKLQKDIEFDAKETNSEIIFTSKNTNDINNNYLLRVPSIFDTESLIPVQVELVNNEIHLKPLYPKILINDHEMPISDEPIILKPVSVISPQKIVFKDIENYTIDINNDKLSYIVTNSINAVELVNEDVKETLSFDATNPPHSVFFLNLPKEEIKTIKVIFAKINSPLSINNIVPNKNYQITEIPLSKSAYQTKQIDINKDGVSIAIKHSQIDLSFTNPNLPHQASYILFASTLYHSGLPINLFIDNPIQQRSELETKLSTNNRENVIILPKTEDYFKGYGFHFVVKSLGDEIANSEINSISLYPIQASFLKGLAIVNSNASPEINNGNGKVSLSFRKINDSLYLVESFTKENSQIVLSQSFDQGWKAYEVKDINWLNSALPFFFGKELKEHVLVNNWANGWLLPDSKFKVQSSKLIIIYWPQYLEYLGFLILGGAFVWLFWSSVKSSRD